MTRLIDADNEKLRYELSTFTRDTLIDEAPFEDALKALDDAPTVDAVEVVRCGECIYRFGRYTGHYCLGRNPYWYCADGERKE